jgi:hypothetical protein
VKPRWAALRAYLRRVNFRAGPGLLESRSEGGDTVFSLAPLDASAFRGAWYVSLTGSERELRARLREGTVNGQPATIGIVPLAGTDKLPPPELAIRRADITPARVSYVAVEVALDETWALLAPEKAGATIVHVASMVTANGKPQTGGGNPLAGGGAPGIDGKRGARYALARLQWSPDASVLRPVAIRQIAYWDLQHRAVPLPAQSTRARHFFWPT